MDNDNLFLTEKQIRTLLSYSGINDLVIDDLKESFVFYLVDDEDLNEIPHPYREYYKAGQRSVVQKVIYLKETAKDIVNNDKLMKEAYEHE